MHLGTIFHAIVKQYQEYLKYPSLDPDTSLLCKPISLSYGTLRILSLLLAGSRERWILPGESLITLSSLLT